MWSLETSQCRGIPHLRKIKLPDLVIQSSADTGVFPSDARSIYEPLASRDKLLEFVPGDHYLQEPATARNDVADRIANWLNDRTGV